jgi:hypothetical protein
MFGKSASLITDYLIQTNNFDPEHCKSLLHWRMKDKADAVIESISGYEINPAQKERMRMVRSHLDYVVSAIEKIDLKLDELAEPYENHIALLCTIPGIERRSAITIISEIGFDINQFSNSKRLCCWAGLTPSNNESAGKKKSVRISRAGVYLKPALVQVAHAAVTVKDSPYYRNKYERISKRRGKKRAIVAIARMILTAVYFMLKSGETWNPSDLCKVDMPPVLQEKQKQKAIQNAIKLLVSQGVICKDDLTTA